MVPLELRVFHAPGWRVTQLGPGGDGPNRRWIHRSRVESPSIRVDRPVLAVPVAGYPSAPGNWLAIEPASDPRARIVYGGPNPGARWTTWWVHAGALQGQEIRLAGAVGNGAGEDWVEFKVPVQTHRLMGLVRDFPSTPELVGGVLLVGLLGFALARIDDTSVKAYRGEGTPESSDG